jgi:hypothetical protein
VETIAAQAFYSIDAHATQYVLEFKAPAAKEVCQAPSAYIGINPLG